MDRALTATLYDGSGPVPWPDTEEARALRAWVEPLWAEGTAAWMENVHTSVYVVVCGDTVLPVTEGCEPGDAWVVSPTAHYVSYALDETRHFGALARAASWALSLPLYGICRVGRFDRVVYVNNWLLSTNLYPVLTREAVVAVLGCVRERWPDHAVVFRSVDLALRAELDGWLGELGARRVFARRIHVVRDNREAAKRGNNRKDAKLARESAHRPSSAVDVDRAAALYRQLYIDKYSTFNPVFSPRLIERAARDGLWELTAWERDGRADAVIGTWTFNGVLTTPLLGYDTERPVSEGLYRLACRGILDRAAQHGVIANRSAGAAAFKQSRGATSHVEVVGVFDGHLGPLRRFPWWLVQTVLDRLVVPLILARNL
ncbi:MAG: GNAT family N-acetyltransferase [Myxococcota bacterium]